MRLSVEHPDPDVMSCGRVQNAFQLHPPSLQEFNIQPSSIVQGSHINIMMMNKNVNIITQHFRCLYLQILADTGTPSRIE
jgi:hypothetical protein